MERMIQGMILLILTFSCYWLIYHIIIGYTLVKYRLRYCCSMIPIIALLLVCSLRYGDTGMDFCVMIGSFVYPFVWLQGNWRKYLLLHISIFFTLTAINEFGADFIGFVGYSVGARTVTPIMGTFYKNMTTLLLLGCVIVSNPHRVKLQIRLTRLQYLLIDIGFIFTGFMHAVINYIGMYTQIRTDVVLLSGMLVSGISIVFVILSIWQGFIIRKQTEYRVRCENSEKMLEQQEDYMRKLQERDQELRLFRHDLQSHLTILEQYSKDNNDLALKMYIHSMVEHANPKQITVYTGLTAIDAVISSDVEAAKAQGIHVKWNGQMPQHYHKNLYALCTIFSNLIKNAIEACTNGTDHQNCIEVEIYPYLEKTYLGIKNTYCGEIHKDQDGHFETSKSDSAHHGYGLLNIEKAVHELDGTIDIHTKQNWFSVEIVI